MKPETEQLLQKLADKLGITTQYLWEVLIRGNRIEGIFLVVLSLFLLVFVYGSYRIVKYGLSDKADYDSAAYTVIGAIAGIISGLAFVPCAYWAVMLSFCPEYGALVDIFGVLKQ